MSFISYAAGETSAQSSAGSSTIMLVVMVAMIAVLYFVMIRPQRKQEKMIAEMKNSLEVGDEITTIGGIIGEVVSIKGSTVLIVSGHDKTKIRILRDAIKTIDVKANGEVPDFSGKKKNEKTAKEAANTEEKVTDTKEDNKTEEEK